MVVEDADAGVVAGKAAGMKTLAVGKVIGGDYCYNDLTEVTLLELLTAEEKAYNRSISKKRIVIEHINRRIKRFKILSDRYRNKRKRHGIRVAIVCAIHNFELNCLG